jgi:acetoin utilization deacetylase AcuC-like enzyme
LVSVPAFVFVTHPDYVKHLTGPGHPERPERVTAITDALKHSSLVDLLAPIAVDPATEDELAAVHTPAYIHHVHEVASHGGGALDPDTVASPDSYEIALLAAGGALTATRAVLEGRARTAFAAVRPPGHHALADRAMGFCLFNNAAVAAADACQRVGLSRVCILDWDVHHGNGTQAIFYRDGRVLYISLHQEHWYPGTGAIDERGEGDGAGFTINVPLPAGTGDDGYRLVFEEVVVPVLRVSAPQVLIISAGYDAHFDDPLGGMLVTAPGFRTLAEMVMQTRAEGAGVVGILEGGYHLAHLATSVLATLEALSGRAVGLDTPPPQRSETPYHTVRSRVRAVRRIVRTHWNI